MNEELKRFGEINTKLRNIEKRISVMENLLSLTIKLSQMKLENHSKLLEICTHLPDVTLPNVGYSIVYSILPLANIKDYTQQYIDGKVPLSEFVDTITNWISEHKVAAQELKRKRYEYKNQLEENKDNHLRAAREIDRTLKEAYSILSDVEYVSM